MPVSLRVFLFVGFVSFTSLKAEEDRTIIDADFSEKTPGGGILARDLTNADGAIPWKLPTLTSINPPSTLSGGSQKIGGLEPPFAFFRVSPNAKTSNEVGGGAVIIWNFPKSGFDSGRFEVSYKITPVSSPMNAGACTISFDDGEGSDPRENAISIWLEGDQFQATGLVPGSSFTAGQTYAVKFFIDLDERVWSVSVDDVPVVGEAELKRANATPVLRFRSIVFASNGASETTPNAAVAFSQVRMTQLK